MARVSVVVSTYNRRDAVSEAIRSVLDQTLEDYEIIIADDGSTDGTPIHLFEALGAQPETLSALMRMGPTSIKPFSHAFVRGDTTIQYHYGINRGLSTARNRGIRAARGEYIAFLEAEDLWDSRHLETLVGYFEQDTDVRVCRVAERHLKDGKPRPRKKPCTEQGWIFETALDASPMATSAVMVHRSCFTACGAFDENLPACEEYDLWLRLAARHEIHYVTDVTVICRSNKPDGSSRSWGWERFRVYALEKAFQSGNLSPRQRFEVAQAIVRKCERLVEGFRRQKSDERSNFYERKRKRFTHEVRKLKSSKVAAVS